MRLHHLLATGLLFGGVAHADGSASPTSASSPLLAQAPAAASTSSKTNEKKLDIKKKKEEDDKKGPAFMPMFSIWEGWGYQRENPYFGTSIYFAPIFRFSEKHRVGAFVGLSAEYTQPDDGRRVFWSNTFLTYTYDVWTPKWGKHKLLLAPGGQLILPTDEGARNRGTMRLAFGPLARAAYTYGIFTISGRVSLLKYLNGSTTEQITQSGPATIGGMTVQEPVVMSTGRANPNFQILSVLGVQLQFTKKLYFDTQLWVINQVPYHFSDDLKSPGATDVIRNSYWAFGEVGYQFTKVFSLGLGFSLSANQLSPDGRNFYLPFNNFNNNFTTYVSLTFSPMLKL